MELLADMEMNEVVGGFQVVATVGINSPKGPKTIEAPATAASGLINAFTNVVTKGPGELSNIDVSIMP